MKITTVCLEDLAKNDFTGEILLFGCGELGKIAKLVAEDYGLKVTAYMSNIRPDQAFLAENTVFTPAEACPEHKDAYVAICVFRDETEAEIKGQLTELGFTRFIDKEDLISQYLKRNIKPIPFTVDADGKIFVNQVTVGVTEHCSLRCKYCGQFTPYVQDPVEYPAEEVILQMQRLARITERIKTVSVIGGEPLLHSKITEIVEAYAQIDNLEGFSITSNGTILPPDSFFQTAAKYRDKVSLQVTDYGPFNRRLDEIRVKCGEYGVNFKVVSSREGLDGMWTRTHVPEPQGRSPQENRNLYVTCQACEFCPFIRNGRQYRCALAAWGERIGQIPFNEKDSVNLIDRTEGIETLKAKMIDFIVSDRPITACAYCHAGPEELVPMGGQITEPAWDLEQYCEEVNGHKLGSLA